MAQNRTQNSVSQQAHGAVINGPKATWVVLADAEHAKVFARHEDHLHFIQRIAADDLAVDGLDNEGIGSNGGPGSARHGYEPSMQQSRQTEIALAQHVCNWLEEALGHHRFGELSIIAAPAMLGELRKTMSKQLALTVNVEADKQLTNHNPPHLDREVIDILDARRSN